MNTTTTKTTKTSTTAADKAKEEQKKKAAAAAEKVAENKAAPTYKELVAAAENIGTTATAAVKHAAALKMGKATNNEYVRELLAAYAAGNSKPVNPRNFVGMTAKEGPASELYKELSLNLYVDAVRYADAMGKADAKSAKSLDKELFASWKKFLSLFSTTTADGDTFTVSPACTDVSALFAAVTKATKEGLKYAAHQKDDGTYVARMVDGIAATTAVPFNSFKKQAERMAAERVLGFDGINSKARSREIAKANAAARDKVLEAAAPVSLEPKADTTAA